MTLSQLLITTEYGGGPAFDAVAPLASALEEREIAVRHWCCEESELPDLASVERIVVLGGDGTMMAILRALEFPSVPLYGVNFGQVGFLMNPRLAASDLAEVVSREDVLEQTFPVLEAALTLESGEVMSLRAVNDFVLERASGQTVHLRTYIDGVLLNRYSGDGLIVATPGGSTAYSLAAGGPVVHWAVPGMVITPLYPHRPVQFHSLQFPILLPLSSQIRVEADEVQKRGVRFVADGATQECGHSVEIRDSGDRVRILRDADYGFVDTLVLKIIGRKRSPSEGSNGGS